MNNRRVAVLAGTPVDAQMGVEYIQKKNKEEGQQLLPLCLPVSVDCDAQLHFQYEDDDTKLKVMDSIFDEEIEQGTEDFFVYCNSLSGAFDFDTYAMKKSLETGKDICIYTPLQIYRKIAANYGCLGVMAAHNLSAHGIEEALTSANPDIYAIGTGNMAIVRAIEDGVDAAEIVKDCGLEAMASYMEASGAEAIVLGCTHFPYLKEELLKITKLPLIDPADEMYKALASKE